jgi:predicted RNA methylase
MIFEYLKLNVNVEDYEFNAIYPEQIRKLAERHWTPVEVAKVASQFLVDKAGAKVLDIGSGAGKFCLVGSSLTKGDFSGVEQREYLCKLSNSLSQHYRLPNVKFIHSNITSINFKEYDAFYFYNSFFENIDNYDEAIIDNTVELSARLYHIYSNYVNQQLEDMPAGTRLVTYWSDLHEVPISYEMQSKKFYGTLKMWLKTS